MTVGKRSAVIVDEFAMGEQYPRSAQLIGRELLFQSLWYSEVVASHQGKVTAAARFDRAIRCGAWTGIRLTNRHNPRVVDGRYDFRRAICRTGLHDDPFGSGECFVEN